MTDSLRVTEEAAAAVAVAPRVSLADLEAKIAHVFYVRGDWIVDAAEETCPDDPSPKIPDVASYCRFLTVCMVVMRNGFIVIGSSAPASPENFDYELGRRLAYEDAIRRIWPLEGYLLRETLSRSVP